MRLLMRLLRRYCVLCDGSINEGRALGYDRWPISADRLPHVRHARLSNPGALDPAWVRRMQR